jgi:hypothetical protein
VIGLDKLFTLDVPRTRNRLCMSEPIPPDSEDLIESVSGYSKRLSEIVSENEMAVQKWLPANEYMVQLLPLSQEAVTVGSDRWYTTKAAWHSKDEAGRYYEHGFDKEDRIRVVRYDTQVRRIFIHDHGFIDELVFAGVNLRGLNRHLFSGGRLLCSKVLSWPELMLTRSDYSYDGDYLIEQRDWHSNNDLEIIYRFRWDCELPVRRLVEITSSFGEKLYVGFHHRKLLHRPHKPVVAFSLDVDDLGDESDGDGLAGQCYSLEMTADFAWEFDRVLFCLPDAVAKITQESEVCNTGLEAGGIVGQSAHELQTITKHAGTWVRLDASNVLLDDLVQDAVQSGVKALLVVDESAIADSNKMASLAFESVAAIVCRLTEPNGSSAREVVRATRNATQSSTNLIRILILVEGNCEIDLVDLVNDSGADGVFIDRVELSRVITVLNEFGLHSYTSVPLSVDRRHVLYGL